MVEGRGAPVAHAHELEEGAGEGDVHHPAVLHTLGQEDAQEAEEELDAGDLLAVLDDGGREETRCSLDVVTRRLLAFPNVNLRWKN